ncbi:hypothetical protein EUGRSUZ_D02373 [Eucalyptus grandis]|uniref:Uncharacterized protein n=2 Tax=Eucalyptus grandis TaxID=71139 RepID=A0ACC3L7V0_EUCGR|nr:hypothetical protein EUGRSUZ_D02373 [Eucalyptus grandis]
MWPRRERWLTCRSCIVSPPVDGGTEPSAGSICPASSRSSGDSAHVTLLLCRFIHGNFEFAVFPLSGLDRIGIPKPMMKLQWRPRNCLLSRCRALADGFSGTFDQQKQK